MPLFNRNKTGINIPSGWHQITIGQYEEITAGYQAILDSSEAHRAGKITEDQLYIDRIAQTCSIIAAAAGVQPGEVRAQPLSVINQQLAALDWLNDASYLRFVNGFELDGTTYIVNPDLSALTPDMFIHMQRVMREGGPRWKAEFIALFVYPSGEKFSNEHYPAIAQLLYDKCPCSVMLPISNYFTRLSEGLRPHIEKHLNSVEQTISDLLEEIMKDVEDTLNEQP